ncbi:hypothetical protein J41TS12_36850 [Paenibacillus antibioticophila]|uniref:Gamma-glutamylcyclotransferase n=1 Tax=Paenibacillus antibioticophila TaxID=1274374 RepID=A0A919XTQ6_9BACL|nr:gamma-glutamylcyclotransferase [Paenibacillus antibioticophila]GIO38824.1 hypothetical protein J41TS12_36850 [Paenibacillus antibioticophila]
MSSIFYAAYGININTVEMKRKFNAFLIGKGFLEGFDLEFRGVPSIKASPGKRVPVAIWQLSTKSEIKLDYDEFKNIGDFKKEYHEIKVETLTGEANRSNLNSNQVTASVYILNEFKPLAMLTLSDYNILFQAYQKQHDFNTAILVMAAQEANKLYEERKFEQMTDLMKYGFSDEESEIVYNALITKWLISGMPENYPSNT